MSNALGPARVSSLLGDMSSRASICLLAALLLEAGCATRQSQVSRAESDWPPSARAAVYSPTATPGFDSPEGVTRLLEQRWSLRDIRSFCIPERRHNPAYQNLVITSPDVWKGRIYPDQRTGFDRISWYATVSNGLFQEYSLEAYRGDDFWLLEIGGPETVRNPPQVTPSPSEPCFIGHK
jgi:hypothetical protein